MGLSSGIETLIEEAFEEGRNSFYRLRNHVLEAVAHAATENRPVIIYNDIFSGEEEEEE